MDWEASTVQGRRSLIAAFILTMIVAGPMVLLSEPVAGPAPGSGTPDLFDPGVRFVAMPHDPALIAVRD